MNFKTRILTIFLFLSALLATGQDSTNKEIDRKQLVSHHNVILTDADTLGSLSVGNGDFAFTVDASGLQSFPEYYQNGIPLGTQSQWGWHSFPNDGKYQIADVAEEFETCNDHRFPVAVQHKKGRPAAAMHWLRTNPHRLHLGLIGLSLIKKDGSVSAVDDLKNIRQELDLWTGQITTTYEVEGVPVRVELAVHQERDDIAFHIESDLIKQGRLKVNFRFPYGNDCHVCPGYDWDHPEKHQTRVLQSTKQLSSLKRTLDETNYYVNVQWKDNARFTQVEPHHFELVPDKNASHLDAVVSFSEEELIIPESEYAAVAKNSQKVWRHFWESGAAIDFTGSTDPRAEELERRIVLSQYLTKIQCAGDYPPQETGLTCNSWYGKFHLEMHWWHGVHFALWNRINLLEKSMDWYQQVMHEARNTAQWQGFDGVRWQKMTGPEGKISPSSVGEFLAWQQPHPIYFAELFYRQRRDKATLEQFKKVVFETADFMTSFAHYNKDDGKYHLCQPLIPAQEIFHATETNDPPFELAYWYYALDVAQQWRIRLGLAPNKNWQHVIDNLAPLPIAEELYLPCAGAFTAYTVDSLREDHPVVTGAYGMLPNTKMIEPQIMDNTFEEIFKKWDWPSTWGWDYPMLAMTAARLGKPDKAIDALLLDVPKNTYLVNGHNYQDKRLRLYLPGNGGLLTAIAMMAAGWDNGPEQPFPGFPKDGKWKIRAEGFVKMP